MASFRRQHAHFIRLTGESLPSSKEKALKGKVTQNIYLTCVSLQNLRQGVFDVIPRDSLDGLTAEDLRLLLNGVGDISVPSLIGYTSFNDESGQ